MKETTTLRRLFLTAAAVGVQALVLGGLASPAAADWREEAIVEAFEDVLDREPSDRELRRYLSRMEEDGWTERDVREDLEERPDERRHSRRGYEDPDEVIRRAYDDILHREPDQEGLRLYRSRMIDDDWTERDVRDALRDSPEYGERRRESAEKIVRRAYEDVLEREPDARGLASYRDKILNEGWDEHDIREALRKSPEHRQQGQMSREQAEEIVKRAYQEVLGREPDAGSRSYVDQVLKDHWTEEDVARELRKSDEYRRRQR
jgi:TorA maturation chaperone TorD